MYPFLRTLVAAWRAHRQPRLGLFDTHSQPVTCLPWDLDGFGELNNGRILTLYDMGRFGLTLRLGLLRPLRARGWLMVVAGSSVRYRARVVAFQRVDLRTRLLGWDDRFLYLEQAMWRGDTCCNHALLRMAMTEKGRLVGPARLADAMGIDPVSPPLPGWVARWAEADSERPWPPQV